MYYEQIVLVVLLVICVFLALATVNVNVMLNKVEDLIKSKEASDKKLSRVENLVKTVLEQTDKLNEKVS